jgi:WD40 repeat protein
MSSDSKDVVGPPAPPDLVGPPAPPEPDPKQARMAQEIKHTSPLVGCRISPSGLFIFAGAQDNTIQRFELANGKKVALTGHESWVRALAFLPEAKQLLSGDYHGKLLWWNGEDDKPAPVRTVEAHDGWLRALAVSPDGKLIASCGNDHKVKLWSAAEGKLVQELEGHNSHVYNVAFHPDGKQLASCDHRGVVKHWDLAKGTCTRDLDAALLSKYDPTFRAHIGGARAMTFNVDGTQLACAGITNVSNAFAGVGNPVVVLFDWAGGKRIQQLAPQQAFQGTMWGIVYHPAGFWAGVAGGSGGALYFWKGDQPAAFHTVKLPQNARDLALHPDGFRLAIAHADGAVRVFDMSPK